MPYVTEGTLTTDKRTVDDTTTWDTQTDWEAYQSKTDIAISNGVVQLAEKTITDGEDLRAWYNFAEEDGTMPVIDRTGNGYDLSNGQYTGVGVSINGKQAGEYDGTDDETYVPWSDITQPIHTFFVFQYRSIGTSNEMMASDPNNNTQTYNNQGNQWAMFTSSVVDGGTPDTNPHVGSFYWDGTNSTLRIDGVEVASGDVGSGSMGGVTLGSNNGSSFAPINAGEFLVYPMSKKSVESDIENDLAGRWGITL